MQITAAEAALAPLSFVDLASALLSGTRSTHLEDMISEDREDARDAPNPEG